MAFDGTLKFDTAIDKTGFKLGLDSLGSLASKGMAAVTAAVTAASGAVSALGGYAVSVGKNFESSMAQVIATMGITKDYTEDGVNSYDLLKEAAAAAGESTTFSASEAADALNYLALAGYDAAKAADALPAVLDLAAAGGLDLAYASDLATDAMAALGIEATSENLTHFGDEMAKTASKANTSVAQLGEAILTVGGTAKSLAGGTTELNAALGVLANRGIKGSEGGTALRNMILALSAPTDKAAMAMSDLGLKVFDASGNMRPMNEIFKDLDSALSKMSEGEKTQVLNKIFNKVDLKSAQAMLAGCGDEFDDLTAALKDCDGAMSQMADTMNDTLEGDLKSLGSKAEAFGIAIYDGINEPLRNLATLGGEYVSQLTAAFKEGGFEGLAESLGDVLGQAITKMSEYLPMVLNMGASVVKNLIDGLISNIDIISESASQILTTIVDCAVDIIPDVLAAGMEIVSSLAQGIADSAPQLADAAISGIGQLIDGFTQNLPKIVESAVSIVSSFAESLENNLPQISKAAGDLVKNLAETIVKNAPETIKSAISILTSLVQVLTDNVGLLLDSALLIIETLVTALLENLDPLIDAAVQFIITLSEYITENTDQLLETALMIVATLVDCLIKNAPKLLAAAVILFGSLIKALFQVSEKIFKAIEDAGAEAGKKLAEIVSDSIDAIADGLSDMLMIATQKASDIVDGVTEFFAELPGDIADTLSETLDNVCDWASDMCDTAKESAKDFLDGIIGFLSKLPQKTSEKLSDALSNVKKWASDHIKEGKNAAKDFIDGIIDFLSKLPKNISDKLSNALNSVEKWASDLMNKGKSAAKDLVDAIVTGVMSLPGDLKDIGKQLVEGLWEGIKNSAGWLGDKVGDFKDGIVDKFKGAFGIHSPSRVMRDSVGKYLAQGVGEGFTEELPDIGKEAVKTFTSIRIVPDIDPVALRALELQGSGMNGIAQLSPTSEFVTNNYHYNTANTDRNKPDSTPINVSLFVDGELKAEGSADITDREQGEIIKLKRRGLAT